MRTCKMCLKKKKIYIQKIRVRETLELDSVSIVTNRNNFNDTECEKWNSKTKKVFPPDENTYTQQNEPIIKKYYKCNYIDLNSNNVTLTAIELVIPQTSEVWYRLEMYEQNACFTPAIRNGPNGSLVVPGKSLSDVLKEYTSY